VIDSDDKIKGLGPKRIAGAVQTIHDIVIPAGTILRTTDGTNFACDIGIGSIETHGSFSVPVPAGVDVGTYFKRVSA
jgi:uncharacterized protein (DUF111 family)